MSEYWMHVIGEVLARREDRGFAVAVQRGLNRATESYAYPYILPGLGMAKPEPVLRAAALAALFRDISPAQGKPFGRYCCEVSWARASQDGRPAILDPDKPDAVGSRLLQLGGLDLDAACLVIRGILALGEDTDVALDYYDLTDTLIHWGNGISEKSQQVRRKLLRDYYSAFSSPTTKDDQSNTDDHSTTKE